MSEGATQKEHTETEQKVSTANNIDAIEGQFYRALGDGKKAAVKLEELVLDVVKSRNTNMICKAVQRAKKKGDDSAARTVMLVVSQVFPECTISKDANGYPVIKIKGIPACKEGLQRLRDVTARGLSIRHQTYRKEIMAPVDEPEVVVYDVTMAKKEASNWFKRHEGDTKAAAVYIAQLQEELKERLAKEAAEEQLKASTK